MKSLSLAVSFSLLKLNFLSAIFLDIEEKI